MLTRAILMSITKDDKVRMCPLAQNMPISLASRFRSPEHMARYLGSYDATLALWPVTPETLDVETNYGITHINVVGAREMPPLILLHGAQVSSPSWYRNVEPLSQHFRVYAVDVLD